MLSAKKVMEQAPSPTCPRAAWRFGTLVALPAQGHLPGYLWVAGGIICTEFFLSFCPGTASPQVSLSRPPPLAWVCSSQWDVSGRDVSRRSKSACVVFLPHRLLLFVLRRVCPVALSVWVPE